MLLEIMPIPLRTIVFISLIVYSYQQSCQEGSFLNKGVCEKCGPCYENWKENLRDLSTIGNFLDFNKLQTDINNIQDVLKNNSLNVNVLKKQKTLLLSQLEQLKSLQDKLNANIKDAGTANEKWFNLVTLKEDAVEFLSSDIDQLKLEAQSKPAEDNNGYLHVMDKARNESIDADKQEKAIIANIEKAVKLCDFLTANPEELSKRVSKEQTDLVDVTNKLTEFFATQPKQIPCENNICEPNTTCQICDDIKICYDKNMLDAANEIIKAKIVHLKAQIKKAGSIPSLNDYLNDHMNENNQIKSVINGTDRSNMTITQKIEKKLKDFSQHDLEQFKSFLELGLKNKDDIENLATKLKDAIDNWNKIRPDNIDDLENKSLLLLDSAKNVEENVQFISKTITNVKNILRGENVTLENNSFEQYLLELSEILDEMERQSGKIKGKIAVSLKKLKDLEKLDISIDKYINKTSELAQRFIKDAVRKKTEIENELKEFKLKIEAYKRILENKQKAIQRFEHRMNTLISRSDDLVQKIGEYYFDEGEHVNKLDINIDVSLKEIEEILKTATNKSGTYEKCS